MRATAFITLAVASLASAQVLSPVAGSAGPVDTSKAVTVTESSAESKATSAMASSDMKATSTMASVESKATSDMKSGTETKSMEASATHSGDAHSTPAIAGTNGTAAGGAKPSDGASSNGTHSMGGPSASGSSGSGSGASASSSAKGSSSSDKPSSGAAPLATPAVMMGLVFGAAAMIL